MALHLVQCGDKPGQPQPVRVVAFLLLCLVMLLPGLLYLVYSMVSSKAGCPQCRQPTLILIDSPVAKAALAAR